MGGGGGGARGQSVKNLINDTDPTHNTPLPATQAEPRYGLTWLDSAQLGCTRPSSATAALSLVAGSRVPPYTGVPHLGPVFLFSTYRKLR